MTSVCIKNIEYYILMLPSFVAYINEREKMSIKDSKQQSIIRQNMEIKLNIEKKESIETKRKKTGTVVVQIEKFIN